MAIEAANLFVKIGADTGGLDSALGGIGGKLKSFGGEAVAFGGALNTIAFGAVAGGVVALGAGLMSATMEAMDAQKGIAQLESVIKSTGGVAGVTSQMAQDLASSLQSVTPFADDAVIAGENMLLTFTNIGKDVFPAATETVLDMSQALGQDVTASAMQLGKALNDPIAGVTALRRVGVQLTDEQEKQVKAMMAVGDTAGAQKVIIAELTKEFGGSAKAAGKTFTGQLAILGHAFDDIKEAIGNAILPMLGKFVDFIASKMPMIMNIVNRTVIPAIENIGSIMSDVFGAILEGDYWEAFDIISESLSGIVPKPVLQALMELGKAIETVFNFVKNNQEAVIGALNGIGLALAGFMAFTAIAGIIAAIANPITLIIGLAALLGAAWANNWGGIQEKTAAVWAVIKPILDEAMKVIGNVWSVVKDGIQPGDINIITANLALLANTISTAFQRMVASIGGWIRTIDWQGLLDGFNKKLAEIITAFTTWANNTEFFNGLGTTVGKTLGEGLRAAFMLVIAEIGSWFSQGGFEASLKIPETMTKVGGDMASSFVIAFIEGVSGAEISPKLGEWISKMFHAALFNANIGKMIYDILDTIDIGGWLDQKVRDAIGGGKPNPNKPTGHVGRASGGSVFGGSPYIVGERGPELFVPGASGTIIPNNKLSTGGTTINLGGITINGGGDASTVKQAAYNGVMAAARAMGAM